MGYYEEMLRMEYIFISIMIPMMIFMLFLMFYIIKKFNKKIMLIDKVITDSPQYMQMLIDSGDYDDEEQEDIRKW